MIKIDRTDTYGWEAAVRGMRNPMNSWDKSDSHYCWEPQYPGGGCFGCELNSDHNCRVDKYIVGAADLDLMKRLIKSGTDHSKFLRMIGVTCDLTAPLYWWKEYDTYKVGTVANSCSTMHKIHAKKFEREDFSTDHLIPRMKEVLDVTIASLNAWSGELSGNQRQEVVVADDTASSHQLQPKAHGATELCCAAEHLSFPQEPQAG